MIRGLPKNTSGNELADYRVIHEPCPVCRGAKVIQPRTREEFGNYLERLADHTIFSWRLSRILYKLWKKDGEFTCDHCGGEGQIERWI